MFTDGSEDNSQCHNLTVRESVECPCHNFYSTPAGSWSSCLVGGVERDQNAGVGVVGVVGGAAPGEEAGLCGVGKRYRALLCTRDDGVLAHPR